LRLTLAAEQVLNEVGKDLEFVALQQQVLLLLLLLLLLLPCKRVHAVL
jgi:hypothetical protein